LFFPRFLLAMVMSGENEGRDLKIQST
jgi:hypothetical protein